MSYSREMTYTDSTSVKMGDPYSTFTVNIISHVSSVRYADMRTAVCFILQDCGVTVLTDAKLNQETNVMAYELRKC